MHLLVLLWIYITNCSVRLPRQNCTLTLSTVMYQPWNWNVKEPDLNHSKHILNLNCFQCLLEVLFIGSNLLGKTFAFDEFSLIELYSLTREIRIHRMSCMDNVPEDYDENICPVKQVANQSWWQKIIAVTSTKWDDTTYLLKVSFKVFQKYDYHPTIFNESKSYTTNTLEIG
jgi:hypothetical protein